MYSDLTSAVPTAIFLGAKVRRRNLREDGDMAKIRFRCPHCGQKLKVARKKAGQTGTCPECDAEVLAPMESDEEFVSQDASTEDELLPSTMEEWLTRFEAQQEFSAKEPGLREHETPDERPRAGSATDRSARSDRSPSAAELDLTTGAGQGPADRAEPGRVEAPLQDAAAEHEIEPGSQDVPREPKAFGSRGTVLRALAWINLAAGGAAATWIAIEFGRLDTLKHDPDINWSAIGLAVGVFWTELVLSAVLLAVAAIAKHLPGHGGQNQA
jgi:hypothetical protein